MGFSLKSVFKGAAIAATGFVANKFLGPVAGKYASGAVSSLMEKKAGGSGNWQPTDTSVTSPSLGNYNMGFYKAGDATSPDRMKTVDADTLNREWEYRLERGFRKVKSGSSLYS
jgi:hypothetical protein